VSKPAHEPGYDDETHSDLGHVASKKVLFGTWGTLMVLTVVTVAASRVHFGTAEMNLLIAMVIAVIKATLVCLFFMHLKYDKLFHTVVFVSAILLATLFVTFALMDSNQYQPDVYWQHADYQPTSDVDKNYPTLNPY
jgi:cytochrome c oxidase subunit IV